MSDQPVKCVPLYLRQLAMYEEMKKYLTGKLAEKSEAVADDLIGSGVYKTPALAESVDEMQKNYTIAATSGYAQVFCDDMLKLLEVAIYNAKFRPI